MVTASHNPPEYNGYKVYWGNGAQIIPPHDAGIARAIDDGARRERRPAPAARRGARRRASCSTLGDERRATRTSPRSTTLARRASDGDRSLAIVYTPMHGVGDALARARARARPASRTSPRCPSSRARRRVPDRRVPEPRGEGRDGSRVRARARAQTADLVLANDPDADRLAVAVPDPRSRDGYVQLTGNQVGVLLGHYLAHATVRSDARAARARVDRLVADARRHRARARRPLRGDAHRLQVDRQPRDGARARRRARASSSATRRRSATRSATLVRDKDGISAAVVFAELAAPSRARARRCSTSSRRSRASTASS